MSDIRTLGDRSDNARAIADAAALGYINGNVIDLTHGLGRFWKIYRHEHLVGIDINPNKSTTGTSTDFRAVPVADGEYDTVVFDPPYKYSGTASDVGPAALNADYGIADYLTPDERDDLIRDGMTEGERILAAGGHMLVKGQDQVVSGRKRWQVRMIANHGEALGLRLVDELLVQSYRAQPKGRAQRHSRIDFSNLLIFRKPTP